MTGQIAAGGRGRAELGLAALVLALGVVVLVGAATTPVPASANVVGPRFFPVVVGVVLVVVAGWLTLDVLRGGHGEAEGGEDVDLSRRSDWRTLALVGAAFVAHLLLLRPAGWLIAGAVLFFGVAFAFGSRRWARDLAIAVVFATAVYLLFGRVLGVTLPTGILTGVI